MAVRVLWLNAGLLLPLDKGGKLRTWHLMRHLSARHEVTYLSFADPGEVEVHRAGMAEACAHLVTVPRREAPRDSMAFYAGAGMRVVDPLPYAVAKYRSRRYRQSVAQLLGTGRFDRVVCDFLVPAVNLPRPLPCPSVLFTHNVEAEIWRRHAETATGIVRRRLYRQQWTRMSHFEARTVGRFDHVLAVSDADRDTLQRLYGDRLLAPVSVVPTGVDTAYFRPAPAARVRPAHLVFVGSMDWAPNEDAVTFFCRDILPRIRRDVPAATLSIVGRAPTAAVRRLAADGIVEVTGRVDDVRPALHEAAVSIVPLRIGGGTRLKIFESMAAGTAVVSTTVGAEGLPAMPGTHLLIADDPGGFADAVIGLLQRPAERLAMARAARSLVEARFDWSVAAGYFERALLDTQRRPAPAVPAAQHQARHSPGPS